MSSYVSEKNGGETVNVALQLHELRLVVVLKWHRMDLLLARRPLNGLGPDSFDLSDSE